MDGRRSTRRSIVLPVLLSGTDFNGSAFNENTWTIGVNRHGAKISTLYRLSVGDQITVGNPALGHSTKARVTRVAEKGHAFEIGVELLEPQDAWEAKTEDRSDPGGENRVGTAEATTPVRALLSAAPIPSANPGSPPTRPEEAGGPNDGPNAGVDSFNSLADFLRASRDELKGLLAKTQEIQITSAQAVQSLLEEVHVRLHKELEVAAASFVNDTHRRVQETTSVALETFGQQASARQAALLDDALVRSQAACQEVELSLKKGSDEYERKLAESSTLALEEFQLKGKALFDSFRTELRTALEELKMKGRDEVSDQLRTTAAELATDLRRRADVGFEILDEKLTKSAKMLVEDTERQVAALSQSSLADLTRAADQTRAGLKTELQQSIEAFQKQIGELTTAALEKNSKTSEFLLHDLQSRLDQAARALQLQSLAVADRHHLTD